MHETEMKIQALCKMKDQLVEIMEAQLAKGCAQVNTEEAGEVIDMIKDLAEAEEKCWKACYYKKIIEAMEEEEREMCEESSRRGYDHWRYSSGRFAPTGHGHRSGYPSTMQAGDIIRRRGYWDPSMMFDGDNFNAEMSPWERYQDAKRHYTETRDPESKHEMDERAKEHIDESMETIRDIWTMADPNMKKQLKASMTAFLGELNV